MKTTTQTTAGGHTPTPETKVGSGLLALNLTTLLFNLRTEGRLTEIEASVIEHCVNAHDSDQRLIRELADIPLTAEVPGIAAKFPEMDDLVQRARDCRDGKPFQSSDQRQIATITRERDEARTLLTKVKADRDREAAKVDRQEQKIAALVEALNLMVSNCSRYLEERPTPMSEMYSEEPTVLEQARAAIAIAKEPTP